MKKIQLAMGKDISIRTLGLAMMSLIPGAGIGAMLGKTWITGALIGFGSSMAIVISFLGVVLTWSGKWTGLDIQNAFRTAAAKAAEGNDEIKHFVDEAQKPADTQ